MDIQIDECFRIRKRARELNIMQELSVAIDGRVTRRSNTAIYIESRSAIHKCSKGSQIFDESHCASSITQRMDMRFEKANPPMLNTTEQTLQTKLQHRRAAHSWLTMSTRSTMTQTGTNKRGLVDFFTQRIWVPWSDALVSTSAHSSLVSGSQGQKIAGNPRMLVGNDHTKIAIRFCFVLKFRLLVMGLGWRVTSTNYTLACTLAFSILRAHTL